MPEVKTLSLVGLYARAQWLGVTHAVQADPDQPGLWLWHLPEFGGGDISYHSEVEAWDAFLEAYDPVVLRMKLAFTTYSEHFGDERDWMAVELTRLDLERIERQRAALKTLGCDRIMTYDDWRHVFFLVENRGIESCKLVVDDTSFGWEGTFKHSSALWDSSFIYFSDLPVFLKEGSGDLRDLVEEDEDGDTEDGGAE